MLPASMYGNSRHAGGPAAAARRFSNARCAPLVTRCDRLPCAHDWPVASKSVVAALLIRLQKSRSQNWARPHGRPAALVASGGGLIVPACCAAWSEEKVRSRGVSKRSAGGQDARRRRGGVGGGVAGSSLTEKPHERPAGRRGACLGPTIAPAESTNAGRHSALALSPTSLAPS